MSDLKQTGPQPGDVPTPSAVNWTMDGAAPTILARSKPENSLQPRDGNIGASQFDGPYGGKKPQS